MVTLYVHVVREATLGVGQSELKLEEGLQNVVQVHTIYTEHHTHIISLQRWAM